MIEEITEAQWQARLAQVRAGNGPPTRCECDDPDRPGFRHQPGCPETFRET